VKHRALDSLNDQLGDPVTALEADGAVGVSIEQGHPNLATVPRIDGAWSVHERDTMPGGQAGPRMHERRIAVGQRDGNAGRHHGPLAGGKLHVGGREQIGARIAGMGADRQRDARIKPLDQDMRKLWFSIR
jgi:hypothetical protein